MTRTEPIAGSAAAVIETSLPLVLASASPRRADLLRRVGLRFTIAPSNLDESSVAGATPELTAQWLAREKAGEVARRMPGHAVLAADTVVALDGAELGKPRDQHEAAQMLQRLSGRSHTVYTGVAVVVEGTAMARVAETEVVFRPLNEEEIIRYVQSGSPMDKAGAYGIQDTELAPVQSYTGSYTNVVGLPLADTAALLERAGIVTADAADRIRAGEQR